jgi:NDP-sugar pyrophosphorylase family protein
VLRAGKASRINCYFPGKVERVELAAILIVGSSGSAADRREQESSCDGLLSGQRLALLPLLGSPVVYHMVNLLQMQGVGKIVVLSETQPGPLSSSALAEKKALDWQQVDHGQIWRSAESIFSELAEGVDEVLVLGTGEYLRLDVQALLTHHYEKRCRVTAVVTPEGQPLDAYVISANRRNDAAYLLRSGLKQVRTPCTHYVFRGYWRSLRTAADFRKLTIDALLRRVPIQPRGAEVRPGVWLAPRARVDARARLVPPVYIGERARVMAGALVTRCAVVEQGAVVCRGGVVENATMLPYTRLGPELELSHSIASGGLIVHLRHQVAVEISDERLLGRVPQGAFSMLTELLTSAIDLCSPRSLRRMLANFPKAAGAHEQNQRPSPGIAPSDYSQPEPGPEGFAADVAVARRYGNQ